MYSGYLVKETMAVILWRMRVVMSRDAWMSPTKRLGVMAEMEPSPGLLLRARSVGGRLTDQDRDCWSPPGLAATGARLEGSMYMSKSMQRKCLVWGLGG